MLVLGNTYLHAHGLQRRTDHTWMARLNGYMEWGVCFIIRGIQQESKHVTSEKRIEPRSITEASSSLGMLFHSFYVIPLSPHPLPPYLMSK